MGSGTHPPTRSPRNHRIVVSSSFVSGMGEHAWQVVHSVSPEGTFAAPWLVVQVVPEAESAIAVVLVVLVLDLGIDLVLVHHLLVLEIDPVPELVLHWLGPVVALVIALAMPVLVPARVPQRPALVLQPQRPTLALQLSLGSVSQSPWIVPWVPQQQPQRLIPIPTLPLLGPQAS